MEVVEVAELVAVRNGKRHIAREGLGSEDEVRGEDAAHDHGRADAQGLEAEEVGGREAVGGVGARGEGVEEPVQVDRQHRPPRQHPGRRRKKKRERDKEEDEEGRKKKRK